MSINAIEALLIGTIIIFLFFTVLDAIWKVRTQIRLNRLEKNQDNGHI